MASSMSALIAQSSRVFLMGHKNADADAIGAACGVAALCRSLGKRVNIIVDLENTTAPKLISLSRSSYWMGRSFPLASKTIRAVSAAR